MRKIVAAVMATFSGLVLLFSYHTSTNTTQAQPRTDPTEKGTTVPTSSTTPSSAPSSGSTSTSTATSGTYTGTSIGTEYGDVQVRITVENSKMTASEAIAYPDRDRRDQQINSYAIPILNEAAVSAQSARIDAVSGATFTSEAYVESLQSALDQANL